MIMELPPFYVTCKKKKWNEKKKIKSWIKGLDFHEFSFLFSVVKIFDGYVQPPTFKIII